MYDLIVRNARLYPMAEDARLDDASGIAVQDGRIAAVGVPDDAEAKVDLDADGACLLPGLVDCHTHAVWAGDRMDEHRMKLEGASYESIARAGGGIASTVKAVRAASEAELVAQSLPRLQALAAEGVTTCEVKSGYGLDAANEIKMLRAVKALDHELAMRLSPTFLGAHSTPPEGDRKAWVREMVETVIPRVAEEGLAETVDIYVENIAYDLEDLDAVAKAARAAGLALRAHTEQLSAMGGTTAAAAAGALSCDHLEYITDDDIQAMADAGTVAVLLPGAFYFLKETRHPPVDRLRTAGVAMAVSTDLNPGSSPVASLLTVMHMAGIFFGMTAEEILLGVTRDAARAMGLSHELGSIEVGKRADFTLWDIPSPEFLVYQLGGIRPRATYIEGREA